MSYIGLPTEISEYPTHYFQTVVGVNVYTLGFSAPSAFGLLVFRNGEILRPGAEYHAGGTTLTLTEIPSSVEPVFVYGLGLAKTGSIGGESTDSGQIIESVMNEDNGYVVYRNGKIEQWGTIEVVDSINIDRNFLKPFPLFCAHMSVTELGPNAAQNTYTRAVTWTKDNYRLYRASATNKLKWFAHGF